jgi:hypothetical protein
VHTAPSLPGCLFECAANAIAGTEQALPEDIASPHCRRFPSATAPHMLDTGRVSETEVLPSHALATALGDQAVVIGTRLRRP